MKISGRHACAFAATLFLACAGCSRIAIPAGAMQPNSAAGSLHQRSWMSPNAILDNLLYVSNSTNSTVTVYSWPQGNLDGTLYGFSSPQGLCVDKKGDVYITDLGSFRIYEYRHGGLSAIKSWVDPYYYPYSCSIEPTTGGLAVADTYSGVLLYGSGSGNPTQYTNPSFKTYSFVGYDDQGNLFVDGSNGSSAVLAELPSGLETLENVYLSKFPISPTALQWDGKYIAVCDAGVVPNVVDEYSVSGRLGTLEVTTTLNSSKAIQQFWIPGFQKVGGQGIRIVAADSGANDVRYWKYPAGGNALKTVTRGVRSPLGVTFSRGNI